MLGSGLTRLQERAAAVHALDFTVGYPRLQPAAEQWETLRKILLAERSPIWADEVLLLREAVQEFIGLEQSQSIEFTFSGSVALERVISAIASSGPCRLLLTTPGFDSIYRFADRLAVVEVLSIDPFWSHSEYVERLMNSVSEDIDVIVLVSPDNPSGFALTDSELGELGARCADVGATLVADQCFLRINPFGVDIGNVSTLAGRCSWLGLWDSSKTVELLGERLGFVFGSHAEQKLVRNSLSEIQYDLSLLTVVAIRRSLEAMTDLKLQRLNRTIAENYRTLRDAAGAADVALGKPDAGSFVVLRCDGRLSGWTSEALAEILLVDHAIAVTPSTVLYPQAPGQVDFIRIALARPMAYVHRLIEALGAIRSTP